MKASTWDRPVPGPVEALAGPTEPQRGLSYMDPAYVDPPRGSLYADFLTWTLLMWTPPYMVSFQNGFAQNDALIAIPWGPASKSPLSSNHTQSTGMLNMKACQLQKL